MDDTRGDHGVRDGVVRNGSVRHPEPSHHAERRRRRVRARHRRARTVDATCDVYDGEGDTSSSSSSEPSECVANCYLSDAAGGPLIVVCIAQHRMHVRCAREWARVAGRNVTCPLCREGAVFEAAAALYGGGGGGAARRRFDVHTNLGTDSRAQRDERHGCAACVRDLGLPCCVCAGSVVIVGWIILIVLNV